MSDQPNGFLLRTLQDIQESQARTEASVEKHRLDSEHRFTALESRMDNEAKNREEARKRKDREEAARRHHQNALIAFAAAVSAVLLDHALALAFTHAQH